MKATLNDLLNAKGVSEPLREAAKALIDRLEAAEKNAAHQKALAESALRMAGRWERKCGELRAKIAEMKRQEPEGE